MAIGIPSLTKAVQHNGGKAQVNLFTPDAFNCDFWALNVLKMCSGWVASGASNTTWGSLIDANGVPTAMPAGGGAVWLGSQVYIYGVAGEQWILDWSGTATLALTKSFDGGDISETINSSNKRTYTLTGNPVPSVQPGEIAYVGGPLKVILTISALTSLSNVRLYRAVDAGKIDRTDATGIFNPDFLARAKQWGVLRFMDWAECNHSRMRTWATRNVEADFNWASSKWKGSWFYGAATQSLNKQTISTMPSLTNGTVIQFYMPDRPVVKTITATTRGSPTTFTSVAHGLTTGNKITGELNNNGGSDWLTAMATRAVATGIAPDFTVTVLDVDRFTIPLDSTGFAAPSGTFQFHPELQISDGTTTKRCVAGDMNNYYNSSWGDYASPGKRISAVYDSTFDVFVISGDLGTDIFTPGIPITAMITLSNYCRAHPWFTFPYYCDDDFWTQLATLCSTTLATGLIPRFESGNEIWNNGSGFWQTYYAQSVAAKLYVSSPVNSDTNMNLAYAKRTGEVSDLIRAVYGTGTNWKMVMGDQGVSSGGSKTNRFQGNSTINGGSSAGYPINKCDYLAYAPYLVPIFAGASQLPENYTGFLTAVDNHINAGASSAGFNWILAEIIAASNGAFTSDHSLETINGWLTYNTQWLSAVSAYGRQGAGTVEITHYEGGLGIAANNFNYTNFPTNAPSGRSITAQNVRDFWTAFIASPQAGIAIRTAMTTFAANSVKFPSQYVLAGPVSEGANWPAYNLNNVQAAPTPLYQELVNWNGT